MPGRVMPRHGRSSTAHTANYGCDRAVESSCLCFCFVTFGLSRPCGSFNC